MCQLNIYMVPKDVPSDEVTEILNDVFGFDNAEQVTQDDNFTIPADYTDKYNSYCCAGMRCNCGSLISKYRDEDCTCSLQQTMLKMQQKKLEEMEEMRDFMERPTYRAEVEEFKKKQQECWDKIDACSQKVVDEEERLTNEIMNNENLTYDEKCRMVQEEVYPAIEKMNEKLKNDPEYIKSYKEYEDLLNQSGLLRTSWTYCLTPEESIWNSTHQEEDSARDAADTDGADCDESVETASTENKDGDAQAESDEEEEEGETITMTLPSNCIYDVIQDCKNEIEKIKQGPEFPEFDQVKELAEKILELADNVKIFAFWQDMDYLPLEESKTVNIQDFKAEDLAYLKYLHVLTLVK